MKKLMVFMLLITTAFLFSSVEVQGITIPYYSDYIEMAIPKTIADDSTYIVTGRLNGGGSATYTEIEMDEEYSRLVVDVLYKTNSVEVKYILEIQSNSNGSWSYVTSFYSTQSSGTITTQILLCDGYSYRLKIENPDNFLGRSTTMQVKWRGMRYVTYGY